MSICQRVIARNDPALVAQVVGRWPLFYSAGADAALDRPAHVRAGSGLTSIEERLVVIQDDANFLAIIEPRIGRIDSVSLPTGQGGHRQFDVLRGNKEWKLDLEACTCVMHEGRETLLALGSGSSPRREHVLLITWPAAADQIQLSCVPAFYAALRSSLEFAGGELNIEGVVCQDDKVLRLFQRGNGAICLGQAPVNATCDISWPHLVAHLRDPASPPPLPRNIQQFDLGTLDGIRLSFTDAAVHGDTILYTAAAEASPDAVADGPVAGSVIGQIIHDGTARFAILQDEAGGRLQGKAEGLTVDAGGNRIWALLDQDDPAAPSELCEVKLTGITR